MGKRIILGPCELCIVPIFGLRCCFFGGCVGLRMVELCCA